MILNEVKFFSEILTLGYLAATQAGRRAEQTAKEISHALSFAWSLGRSHSLAALDLHRTICGRVELSCGDPAVHLSFYNDMAHGGKYWQFISEEVPAVVRDMFPLSSERKGNYVAGLSMGGYGAFKLALTHPERFAAAASLSGALDIRERVRADNPRNDKNRLTEMLNVFGDPRKLPGSKHDLIALAKKVAKGSIKPRLYQCCGTEDFLYEENLHFRDVVRKLPLDLTYEEGPGEHNWTYWDKMIQNVLAWMFPHGKKS